MAGKDDDMKIAVVFPGIGYHTDKPLLFYSKKIAAAHGYEVRDVSYGNFPSGSKGKKDLMADCFFSALEQSEKLMADVDFSRYDDILFLSKSIGTAVASAYSRKHGLKTKNVYFTPPEGSFRFMDQPGIVFHGSSDEMADTVFVTEECRKRDWSLHTIENANHSLEVGDWERDLGTLYGIMLAVDQYLTETEKQPEHIAGTVKLDVVMNAVEMADDMSTYFLDTKTGESIFLSEMDRDDAAWDEIEDAEPGRYLRLPTQFDIHEYKIMEDFIYELPEGKIQNQLANAIQGRGAFRRFKDMLYRFGMEQEWYQYRDAAFRKIALEWCEENGLQAEE